jgi:hypothetical protein
MELILTIPWYFFDAKRPELPRVLVNPGRYPVETIANPLGQSNQPWIVLAGTHIGMNADSLRAMHGDAWGDFAIKLIEATPESAPIA